MASKPGQPSSRLKETDSKDLRSRRDRLYNRPPPPTNSGQNGAAAGTKKTGAVHDESCGDVKCSMAG